MRVTYVITSDDLVAAQAKCKQAKDVPEGKLPGLEGMFMTPLVDEKGIITHYISSGILSDAEIAYLDTQLPPAASKEISKDPFEKLAEMKVKLKSEALV